PAGQSTLETAVSACALPVMPLPTATPMRRVPKSKPSATLIATASSGVSGVARQLVRFHAQLPRCSRPAPGDGCGENDLRVGRGGQAAVFQHFAFQLAIAPAGVAERNQVIGWATAVADGFEYVARRGNRQVVACMQGRFPFAL